MYTIKENVIKYGFIALIIAIISAIGLASTFAKYVSDGGYSSDSARVAKWGITIDSSFDSFFSSEYNTEDASAISAGLIYSAKISPESLDGNKKYKKIIAPGTKKENSGIFKVQGSAEAAVRVTPKLNFHVNCGTLNWIDRADPSSSHQICYMPVVFKVVVDGTSYTFDCADSNYVGYPAEAKYESLCTDLNNWLKNTVISSATKDFAPGTDLTSAYSYPTIGWEWTFVDNSRNYTLWTGGDIATKDELDTLIGEESMKWRDSEAEEQGLNSAPHMNISCECTVSQID